MVDILPTGKWSPTQAVLQAKELMEDMDQCVILYMEKGEDMPRVIASSMTPCDMHFFGFALQTYACGRMDLD